MKYFGIWISATAIFCGLAFGFSILLLDLPVEIRVRCQTSRPVKLKLYPSRFLDRAIDRKHEFDAELRPASPDPNATGKVKIPLSSFRKIRLKVPRETEFELTGIDCRILGIWQQNLSGKQLFSIRGSDELELTPLLTPETAMPLSLKIRTGKRPGSCDIRLVNDFPRFMALFSAIVAAVLTGLPLLLILNGRFRNHFKQYLYPAIFLFLLYGGTVIAALISGPKDRPAGPNLNLASLSSYPEKFTRWYQRNLPFRDEIFNLHYRCCSLLGISPVEKVMTGQDGWLFIKQFQPHSTYEDYLCINLFTETQLKTILEKLEHARSKLQEKKNPLRAVHRTRKNARIRRQDEKTIPPDRSRWSDPGEAIDRISSDSQLHPCGIPAGRNKVRPETDQCSSVLQAGHPLELLRCIYRCPRHDAAD